MDFIQRVWIGHFNNYFEVSLNDDVGKLSDLDKICIFFGVTTLSQDNFVSLEIVRAENRLNFDL